MDTCQGPVFRTFLYYFGDSHLILGVWRVLYNRTKARVGTPVGLLDCWSVLSTALLNRGAAIIQHFRIAHKTFFVLPKLQNDCF